ncbi:MAG: ferritin family protein [Burkholderiales bacterium]|nr:MAG: ferritin family protein [Burkholderiales bacterium]
MTQTDAPADAIAMFYAHAIALENEAAERYRELADQMEAHHNEGAKRLFRWLAGLEAEHASELQRKAEGMTLPRLKPWEYRWVDEEAPESASFDTVHYLMTARHALEVALTNERRAREFFERYAESAEHPEVKRLATEMAMDEAEHERYVRRALDRVDETDAHWDLDLDPPQTAE